MIRFYEEYNLFLLNGKDISYVIYVNKLGLLQFIYFGKKINEENIDYLAGLYGETIAPKKEDFNHELLFNYMPNECGFFGRCDYREPTVLIEKSDGSFYSRFRYISHEIIDSCYDYGYLPHIRRAYKTLSIFLKDDFSNVLLKLNYSIFDDEDIIVRNIEITNTKEECINIKRALSFCLDLPSSQYKMMKLPGAWAQERMIETHDLTQGVFKIESTRGASSHHMNPFLGILKDSCSEESGECYGFTLLYSGSYLLSCEMNSSKVLRVQGGINDFCFSWELNKDETFITPQAVLCYSSKGIGEMSRSFSNFFRKYVINPSYVFKKRPIVLNNWEATYFDFTEEKLLEIINAASTLGVDTFVLDDGWFGERNDDTSSLGDWFINEKKLPNGFEKIIQKCKECKLKFGLWFEPEMISENSELYKNHPEWAIGNPKIIPARWRNQLVLDYSNDDVIEYVYKKISYLLKRYPISYVKWDMNRNISEYFSNNLDSSFQGELLHRYMLGVYKLADRLTKEFSDVFFEGCAGGGGRFDGGMLYYFPQIWTSDDTDAYERTKIQYGTSICYPLSSMSCHVSVCPNHQTQRTIDLKTRSLVASLGSTGIELDPRHLIEDDKNILKNFIKNYKEVDELILFGDLYRLKNPFKDNAFCFMIVSKDKNQAFVVYQKQISSPDESTRILKLHGLDENKNYYIKELNCKINGSVLVNVGIILPWLKDFSACSFNIVSVGE